jgi:hypothetical protein
MSGDQSFPRPLERGYILIDPNQTTLCAEAFCDFVAVPAQAHRCVDIGPTAPNIQKIDRFF